MSIELPTEKQAPSLDPTTSKILLYGQPGIGKTTFASQLDEKTLIVATEPGTGGIEAYVQRVTDWNEFRQLGALLAAGGHGFTGVAIDTTDELFRMCQAYVMEQHKIKHPSDLDFGKGWQLLTDEFRLRVGKFSNLGLGVVFVSHAKEIEVKQRVGSITKSVPTLAGQAGKFITGFVDYIFFATFDEENQRVIRTSPTEYYDAKQRTPLPDPLPLNAAAVRAAMAGEKAPA